MAAMANILVKDDTTGTVVEHTLIPVTDTPIPFWRGSLPGVPLEGQIRLYMSTERVKSGAYKITQKLEVPVMETLGASGTAAGYVASPKVAFVNTSINTSFVDGRSTVSDRANLAKLSAGIAQGASATTATGILNQASAADVWKNSTLPSPLLFTQLVLPN
jgi:hypothetical protein